MTAVGSRALELAASASAPRVAMSLLGAASLLAVAAGCAAAHPGQARTDHRPAPHGSVTGQVRIVKRVRTVPAGRRVELVHEQRARGHLAQVDLVLTVSRPVVSHAALSSYAYPPVHGSYLTFRISMANRGQVTVLVKPTDFTVNVGGGQSKVTSYDGNAPYSGARQQLDTTALAPGQSVSKPLTYDVSHVHGVLSYAPERKPAIRWRF